MFSFFQTFFHKITTVVATVAIAIGLVSAPKPIEQPITNNQSSPVIEQQIENDKFLKQEVKKSEPKKEIETPKTINVEPPVVKQEQAKTTVEEQINQRKNYDPDLSQWIAETRQRINTFNSAIQETNNLISRIRVEMNKYPNESIIQQSGQELINENNNLASISRSLVTVETERVNKISSYLGLGLLPSVNDFTQIKQQYDSYYQQYQVSNEKIDSLIKSFVSTEKSALQDKLAQEKRELDELKQLLSQQISARQQKLADLKTQIEYYQNQYDSIDKMAGGTESIMAGKKAAIASKLNPLINEYNSLIGNFSGQVYSPVRQTYLKFTTDSMGGGTLYDPYNSSIYYNFTCDGMGGCSIYSQ